MALYYYHAFSKDGKKVSGYIDAVSESVVKEQLQRRGIFPISINRAVGGKQKNWWRRLFQSDASTKDIILFTKQLAVLLKSGVPLLQAFELLSEQFSGSLQSIVVAIKDDLKEGRSLADAMANYPKVFDNIYVQLVKAGEASGKLEIILERLEHNLLKQEETRKRISSAMAMPILQLIVAIGVVAVMMIKVVPTMAKQFASQKKELPTATKIVVGLSEVVQHYWMIILLLSILLVALYSYWVSTPSGRKAMDQFKLRVPFVKYFTKTNAVVQFSSTLGMLIESGVNLAESLDIVVNIIGNRVLADTLHAARDNIIKQGRIAQYLKQTDIFPPIAIYLIKTGEESGKLDSMLLTVAHNYEDELSELTDRLTTVLSPLLLVLMALIVGFIVIAVAVPMMDFSRIGV